MNKQLKTFVILFWILFFIPSAMANSEYTEICEGIVLEATDNVAKGCEAFEMVSPLNDTAILMIHGLGGCPHEVRSMGEYLGRNGFNTYGVRYPGHGTTDDSISDYQWQDWYNHVENKYKELTEKYEKVYVLGFSTGATLSLKLAQDYEVDKLVLLSTFISITHKWYYGLKPEIYLNSIGKLVWNIPSGLSRTNLNDPKARAEYVRGKNFSFESARRALKLIETVKNDINKVKSPVLLMHSKNDETTDYRGSQYIYDNISSEKKEIIFLEKSNHIITLDYEKEFVYQAVEKFLAE